MAKLFISYAHEDRPLAERLAVALQARDHEVWWDHELASGDAFRKTIESQLKECEAAIVIWSPHSIQSKWVVDEADDAVSAEKFLPVCFETELVRPPLGFRNYHIMSLAAWKGDARANELAELDKKIDEIQHGNFRGALLELGRRAGNTRGGETAAFLFSRLGSNIGGLPILRLLTGSAIAGIGLAALQTVVGLIFGGGLLDYLLLAPIYVLLFMILRAAHQPVALRLGHGRRYYDDAFKFWILFSALAAVLFFSAMGLAGAADAPEMVANAPALALIVLSTVVLARLFASGLSFLFRNA